MERIKQALDKAKAGDTSANNWAMGHNALRDGDSITYSQSITARANPGALTRNLVRDGSVNDPATTAYKILRTQVEQRMAAKGWNTLAITSASAGAGKTTTAVNLAMAIAREVHRTVLLADLDLRHPSVHRFFGLEPHHGIIDFLLDDVPISEILIHPGIDHLVILPGGRVVQNSSEILASPRMMDLVDDLKQRYASRIVIFDLPPLLSTADTLAFAPYVDCVLLVVEDGRTTKEELLAATELLANANLLGTVLNRSYEQQPVYF